MKKLTKEHAILFGIGTAIFLVCYLIMAGKDIMFLIHPEDWQYVEGYDNTYDVYIGQGAVQSQGDYQTPDHTPPTIKDILIPIIPCALLSFILTRAMK